MNRATSGGSEKVTSAASSGEEAIFSVDHQHHYHSADNNTVLNDENNIKATLPELSLHINDDDNNDNDNNIMSNTLTTPTAATSSCYGACCCCHRVRTILMELWSSTDLLFQNKSTWLLILGPIAVIGNATGTMGEALCFTLSGIALIPCAERLSFVTERLADHTNGTIGALLNATFGNAPELLITIFALRSGYYRVVQLAMLGSMLTNMTLVFGAACLIGGLKWHVQDLRMTSGNVSVGMLLLATAGMLFPAALVLSGQLPYKHTEPNLPTPVEVTFCRVNAFVMMILYILFLVFTVGSHKDEFDDNGDNGRLSHSSRRAKRNLFCLRLTGRAHRLVRPNRKINAGGGTAVIIIDHNTGGYDPLATQGSTPEPRSPREWATDYSPDVDVEDVLHTSHHSEEEETEEFMLDRKEDKPPIVRRKNSHSVVNTPVKQESPSSPRILRLITTTSFQGPPSTEGSQKPTGKHSEDFNDFDSIDSRDATPDQHNLSADPSENISMTICIIWLFIITFCISAMTDILVDTIDGFAQRMDFSEVFTSMVIVPFFSNVAEQISAFIFAYRNEMDLCVGVTVGSAIQIATFVLPASVLMGMVMDRSMTLYFHGYETVCMFFAVVTVAAVLQGGTTNWLVGAILIGIYVMFAAGIWFHESENLTTDEEIAIRNVTDLQLYNDRVRW